MVIGALALLMALPAGEALASGSCSQTISSCGCTITSPGFYQVTANLSSTQGLTGAGDCIDVHSVGVTLWTAGYSITGSGSGAEIELGSVGTFVEGTSANETGDSTISGWDYGVELESAIQVTMEAFQANNNAIAGVYLSNSINNTVSDFAALANGLAGVLLDHSTNNNINTQATNDSFGDFLVSSSNNQINDAEAESNATAGVEIGCPNTTVWSGCKSALPSNGNQVYDSTNQFNGAFGIVVENGGHKNVIADNFAGDNPTTDLVDHNPSCDQDLWFANFFSLANPASCIH